MVSEFLDKYLVENCGKSFPAEELEQRGCVGGWGFCVALRGYEQAWDGA